MSRLLVWFIIVSGLLLFVMLAFATILTAPMIDDGVNAVLAKNLAFGHGYCTSFFEFKCFDPRVTTGPTLILPAASLISVFGNVSWLPSATNFVFVSILLVIFSTKVVNQFDKAPAMSLSSRKVKILVFAGIVLTLFLVGNETKNSGEYAAGRGFTKLVGEFTAILLFWIGLLNFAPPKEQRLRKLFVGALTLGTGILTKTIMLLPTLVFLISYFYFSVSRRKQSLVCFVGAFIPVLSFEIAKLCTLGFAGYVKLKRDETIFFQTAGSGISGANKVHEISHNLFTNLGFMSTHLGGWLLMLALLYLLFTVVSRSLRNFEKQEAVWLSAIVIASLSNVFWWLMLSNWGWIRHLFPGILSLGLICFLLGVRGFPKMSRFEKCYVSGVLSWFIVSHLGIFVNLIDDLKYNGRLADFHQTVRFLNEQKDSELFACSNGWYNADLEYGLMGINNFRACNDMSNAKLVKGKTPLLVGDAFDWEKDPVTILTAKGWAGRLVFKAGGFTVSEFRISPTK